MNKRRMKYRYWDRTRTCHAILASSSVVCNEVPPGGVFYGLPKGRGDDSPEGKGLGAESSPDVRRPTEISYAGRKNLPSRSA